MENLRELRNKILGEPKLEFGCEVMFKNEEWIVIHTDIKEYWEIVVLNNLKDRDLNVTIENEEIRSIKIIGKPVTLQEVLLMMNNKIDKDTYLAINTSGLFHDYINDELVAIIRFDLTLPPEQQTPEVIEKIISLIE